MKQKPFPNNVRAAACAAMIKCSPLLAMLALAASHATAQAFPVRPIRLVSPFSPGGGNDLVCRILAVPLTRDFGQTVVVDNRPGGNTVIGMDLVAKSAADGYTVGMSSSTQAINATLYTHLPYDSIKDFSAVSLVGSSPLVVAVPASSPINSITELIAAAKAHPGQLSYPSAGTGNTTHLGGELFAAAAGISLLHVPYKGSAPGITDLIAGRHAVAFSTSGSLVTHIQSGRLRALATTGAKRFSAMPQLPTVAEAGLPGYQAGTWYGVVGPAGIDAKVLARLSSGIVKALAVPEVRQRLIAQGIDPVGTTPAEFSAYMQSEVTKFAKIIRAINLKPE